MAKPANGLKLTTSAQPVRVSEVAGASDSISRVARAGTTRVTSDDTRGCEAPSCVMTRGSTNGIPSSPWNATVTEFAVDERFRRVRVVFQPPPDAI
jgi:hypothetical protein